RGATEQLALDEVVGRFARAQLFAAGDRRGHHLAAGQLVLFAVPSRREISDDQDQQQQPADQGNHGPVEPPHRLLNASLPAWLHYSSRPSCSLTTRSIFAAIRSL